jgi:hypothetical protein
MFRMNKRFGAVTLFIVVVMLLGGCAGGQAVSQDKVINEYLLTEAGFGKLDVNDQTPKRQALFDAAPPGKFITYWLDGAKWYVYASPTGNSLYLGDEAAYRKFSSKQNDKKLCQSMDAENSAPFWACYQEMQSGGQKK